MRLLGRSESQRLNRVSWGILHQTPCESQLSALHLRLPNRIHFDTNATRASRTHTKAFELKASLAEAWRTTPNKARFSSL
jgi:hypothetical protein